MGGAAAAYRQLLRAIRRSIKTANELQQWEKYAREQFLMAAAHGPDASLSSTAAVQDAVDYAFLVDSVRQHKELLLSYNIGIPVDEREKNMNARAAKFVGLEMPKPLE